MVAFIKNSERGVWLLLKRTIEVRYSWKTKKKAAIIARLPHDKPQLLACLHVYVLVDVWSTVTDYSIRYCAFHSAR